MFVKETHALEQIYLNTQGEQLREKQGYLLAIGGIGQACR